MNTSADMFEGAASLLRELRDRDGETGLLRENRLYQALLGEVARSDRYGNPLSCVLMHLHGMESAQSKARMQLATKLADSMRTTDYAGMWHDEEFLLVLPETDEPGARDFADKVKQELTELASRLHSGGSADVTVTTRLTTWQSGDDADAILERLETKARP